MIVVICFLSLHAYSYLFFFLHSSLLDTLTVDITQFLSDELDNLSKIYCIQIELGNLPLKSVSLKFLRI